MGKYPFSENELEVKYSLPNIRTNVDVPHFHSPVTAAENIKRAIFQKEAVFFPDWKDFRMLHPRVIPDTMARSSADDGGERIISPAAADMFGVEWVYIESAHGAMVRPGNPVLTDMNDWEEKITWPDIDEWDWEGQARLSEKIVSETELAIVPQLFTGYFERMLSLMDVDNACVALIDEDQEDAVKAFLDRLADLHIRIIDRLVQCFPVDGISIHDDWGTQRAPFFSLETAQNILVPAHKKVADHIHELGLFYDFHCCGQVEELVPAMLEIGVDAWSGPPLNDKRKMYRLYGDRILLGVEPPAVSEDLPDDEAERLAAEFVDTFFEPGRPAMIGANSSIRNPKFYEAVYRYSREKGFAYEQAD